jgi:peptidoglycan/LPS O-acetylase OafA/YrhL
VPHQLAPGVTANTEHPAPVNRAYFPALDGLRGAAFLGVFLHHYMNFLYGWAGVDVFFVLSGFLITGILYDTQDDPHRARNFYIRRTLRIFPLYYGVLLFIFLLTPLIHWAWTWQWIAWPLYLGNFLRFLYPHRNDAVVFYFANAQIVSRTSPGIVLYLGHFWSLCVEEQFYLIWPWIVFALRDRRELIAICVTCIVLVPFARAFATAHMPVALVTGDVVLHATPFRFDTLMFGALVALIYRGPHRDLMQRIAQYILPVAVLCALAVAVHRVRFHSYTYPAGLSTWLLTLIAIFSAALMLRTLVPGTIPYRFFHLRWLRALGTVSYGAYVFHDIFHDLLSNAVNQLVGLRVAAWAFGLTIILASISYRYFESPILRLKDRLTRTA